MRLVPLFTVFTIATAIGAALETSLDLPTSTLTSASRSQGLGRRAFSFPKMPKDDPPVRPEPYSVTDGEPGAVENGPAHLSIPESGFHKPTPTPGPDDPMVIPSPKPSATPVLDPNDLPQPDLPDSSSTSNALPVSLTASSPLASNGTRVVPTVSANTTVTATSEKFSTIGDGTPFTGSGTGKLKVSVPYTTYHMTDEAKLSPYAYLSTTLALWYSILS